MPSARTFKQLLEVTEICTGEQAYQLHTFYAVASDGTLWTSTDWCHSWKKCNDLPQEEDGMKMPQRL